MISGFDFGVSLSLYLSIGGLVLCIAYGLFYWNKDSEEQEIRGAKRWEQEEEKINEEM